MKTIYVFNVYVPDIEYRNVDHPYIGKALVHICDGAGVLQTVRAIVDSASQISTITSTCSSRLRLRLSKWTAPVTGLSGATVHGVQGLVDCQVQPRFATEPVFELKLWVFPTITADMPRQPVATDVAERYRHLALADPAFTVPTPVDMLLGADVLYIDVFYIYVLYIYIEKRLMSDQRFRSLYCQFMAEYLSNGHMSPASSVGSYFIPHHAVYQPSDTDLKIRDVFDASAKDYSGTSLNDDLFPGPKLQQDFVNVLLLFRLYRYAFTCDVSKMYRLILFSPEH